MSKSTKCVPSLADRDWDTSPLTNLDKMLGYSHTADYSQSNQYQGAIFSMSKIYQEYDSDPTGAALAIEEGLTKYLQRRYVDVNISVIVKSDKETDSDRYVDIYMSGTMEDEDTGELIQLNHGIQLKNSVLEAVYKEVNS